MINNSLTFWCVELLSIFTHCLYFTVQPAKILSDTTHQNV